MDNIQSSSLESARFFFTAVSDVPLFQARRKQNDLKNQAHQISRNFHTRSETWRTWSPWWTCVFDVQPLYTPKSPFPIHYLAIEMVQFIIHTLDRDTLPLLWKCIRFTSDYLLICLIG